MQQRRVVHYVSLYPSAAGCHPEADAFAAESRTGTSPASSASLRESAGCLRDHWRFLLRAGNLMLVPTEVLVAAKAGCFVPTLSAVSSCLAGTSSTTNCCVACPSVTSGGLTDTSSPKAGCLTTTPSCFRYTACPTWQPHGCYQRNSLQSVCGLCEESAHSQGTGACVRGLARGYASLSRNHTPRR